MKLILFRPKMFRAEPLQSREFVPEDVKFFGGVALTLLLPTLFYCVVIGQLWPFYLMTFEGAFGTILGFAMFTMPAKGLLSCIPFERTPKVMRRVNVAYKEAA